MSYPRNFFTLADAWALGICDKHALFSHTEKAHKPPCQWDWDKWFTVRPGSTDFKASVLFSPTDALIQRMNQVKERT